MIDWNVLPSHAVGALVGTGVISGLVKGLDIYFRSREKVVDSARVFRDELRARVAELVGEVRQLDADMDVWKAKYYGLMEEQGKLRAKHKALCLRFEEVTGETVPADEGEGGLRTRK